MRPLPVPQKEGPRANRDIRGVREVQLIDDTGQNRGVMPFFDALRIAGEICIYSNQNIIVEEL